LHRVHCRTHAGRPVPRRCSAAGAQHRVASGSPLEALPSEVDWPELRWLCVFDALR
jgi:hypothetical protein